MADTRDAGGLSASPLSSMLGDPRGFLPLCLLLRDFETSGRILPHTALHICLGGDHSVGMGVISLSLGFLQKQEGRGAGNFPSLCLSCSLCLALSLSLSLSIPLPASFPASDDAAMATAESPFLTTYHYLTGFLLRRLSVASLGSDMC